MGDAGREGLITPVSRLHATGRHQIPHRADLIDHGRCTEMLLGDANDEREEQDPGGDGPAVLGYKIVPEPDDLIQELVQFHEPHRKGDGNHRYQDNVPDLGPQSLVLQIGIFKAGGRIRGFWMGGAGQSWIVIHRIIYPDANNFPGKPGHEVSGEGTGPPR
jgi:hypothetical protein